MVPEKFRRQLRQETEQWWKEGLINAELYEQLAERYRFQALEQEASHRFIAILIGLGCVLLGLGAITFVAANWQEWSRLVKLVLLLSLFIVVNATGFHLWQRPAQRGSYQRLGQGLLLLGGLLLGANLALMSQMFHQSGDLYELLLVWGLGVIAMAYSLRLASLGVLAWILLGLGYMMGFSQFFINEGSGWPIVLLHFPLIAGLLFIPLAYYCRSKVLFGLGAALVSVALASNLLLLNQSGANGWLVALAFVLPPALLWSYQSRIWRSAAVADPFQPIARTLALCFLSVLFSVLAFRFWWQVENSSSYPIPGWLWWGLVDAFVLTVIAGLGWLQLGQEWRRGSRPVQAINSLTVAGLLLLIALLQIWQFEVGALEATGTLLANLMLFGLAIGLVRDGLAFGHRLTFWGGMVLLVLGILCRTLEYDTGLLLKSVVFVLCGLGLILAGLRFERQVKLIAPTQENWS
jgi:uncharacterized membrane protein